MLKKIKNQINILLPKGKPNKTEELLVKLICIKQAQITAEDDFFREHSNSLILEEDKDEWDKMLQTEKRIDCLRDFLAKKEKEYIKELMHLSPFLAKQLEQMIFSCVHDYNISYHEQKEMYFPIPSVLDGREPGHNMPLGTFKNSEEACLAMWKKKENRSIFHFKGKPWTPQKK